MKSSKRILNYTIFILTLGLFLILAIFGPPVKKNDLLALLGAVLVGFAFIFGLNLYLSEGRAIKRILMIFAIIFTIVIIFSLVINTTEVFYMFQTISNINKADKGFTDKAIETNNSYYCSQRLGNEQKKECLYLLTNGSECKDIFYNCTGDGLRPCVDDIYREKSWLTALCYTAYYERTGNISYCDKISKSGYSSFSYLCYEAEPIN